jgi:ATP-binding cassette subfamily F protein 3
MLAAFDGVTYRVAGRTLLEKASFQIQERQHVGLVGRNGAGKSTLFHLLEGQLSPDDGSISVARDCGFLSLKQEMPEGHLTPLAFLLSQDQERASLMRELGQADTPDGGWEALDTAKDAELSPERMAEIYTRLSDIDAYTAPARAAKVLKGLGFSDDEMGRPLAEFSGGWRMRAALGAVLYQNARLLLLDEPTNHLDFETVCWLQKFLSSYAGAFIVISHERSFLNAVCSHIVHLKGAQLATYKGNFDTFVDTYTIRQSHIAAHNERMEARKQHMMRFVERFRAKATKAKQAQSRLKAIEKLHFVPTEKADPTVAFHFPAPRELSPPMLTYDKVALGYGDRTVLRHLSGTLAPDARLALVGANGNGKTTFARFLGGELEPLRGKYEAHGHLQVGFYRQDLFETLDLSTTPLAQLALHMPHALDGQLRTHLGQFGFSKDKAEQRIGSLSGGERARLVFACLTVTKPNFLILDEPTNHLDIEMRESLVQTLNTYRGAVVLITHDQALLEQTVDELWVVANGTVTPFDGDVSSYMHALSKGR